VQGSQLLLEKVNTEDFMLTFDCSGIEEPGTYELEVSPDVPRGVLVLKYSPTSVEVEITRLEESE